LLIFFIWFYFLFLQSYSTLFKKYVAEKQKKLKKIKLYRLTAVKQVLNIYLTMQKKLRNFEVKVLNFGTKVAQAHKYALKTIIRINEVIHTYHLSHSYV